MSETEPPTETRPTGEPVATRPEMAAAVLFVILVIGFVGAAVWTYLLPGDKSRSLSDQQIAAIPAPTGTPIRGYWPASPSKSVATKPQPSSKPNPADDTEATDRIIYASTYQVQLESSKYSDFRVTAEGDRATDLVIRHPRMSTALAEAAFYDDDLHAMWLRYGFRRVIFKNSKGGQLIHDLK